MTKPLPIPDFTDVPRYPQDEPTEWVNDEVEQEPKESIIRQIFNWFIKRNKGE